MNARITGIMLCGGPGRRLDGIDKPLKPWRGTPLATRVAERLRPQVETLLISANRNLPVYRRLAPVVRDRLPGHAGPLAGIAAALPHCQTPLALICPGDTPLIPADLGNRLAQALNPDGESVAAPAAFVRDNNGPHPLHCLASVACLDSLHAYLTDGGRRVEGWLRQIGALAVDFQGQEACFRNFNNPEDFRD